MPRSATRTEPNDQKTLEKSDGTAAGISGAESAARAAAHTERPPALTMAARERERERERTSDSERIVEETQRERERERENGELVGKSVVVALDGMSIVFGSKWEGFYDPSSLFFFCHFLFLSLFFNPTSFAFQFLPFLLHLHAIASHQFPSINTTLILFIFLQKLYIIKNIIKIIKR